MAPVPENTGDWATERFLAYRELLFSVVYTMLGSVADTEDVLQEAWLAWMRRHRHPSAEPVENARAYLVRVAANTALARRAELNRRRETYVGQWLPEPLVSDDNDPSVGVERTESLSMALLVVMEALSPLERAAFVLHDVFGFSHPEVAVILDRSPTAVRQLATRGRRNVQARRPRHRAEPDIHAEVTERFAAAALGGDLTALMEVLAPDVTLWTDSGGKGPATSLQPVHGRDAVVALFLQVAAELPGTADLRYRRAGGDPCALVIVGAALFAVVVVDLDPGQRRITGIYSITNPDKFTGVR